MSATVMVLGIAMIKICIKFETKFKFLGVKGLQDLVMKQFKSYFATNVKTNSIYTKIPVMNPVPMEIKKKMENVQK